MTEILGERDKGASVQYDHHCGGEVEQACVTECGGTRENRPEEVAFKLIPED